MILNTNFFRERRACCFVIPINEVFLLNNGATVSVNTHWQEGIKVCVITADGDCSHEIKRRLPLGRKVMTNIESILKSRDIILSTKVCLVKAMVFPVVMHGCESCTIKKAERR